MIIVQLDPDCDIEHDVGFILTFLDEGDPRPAREQFQERYVYGGWKNQSGFKKSGVATLHYPGDPPLEPLALIPLRHEKIFIYPGAYVAIFQPDGSFEACRMD
jgi:hypothetical protein